MKNRRLIKNICLVIVLLSAPLLPLGAAAAGGAAGAKPSLLEVTEDVNNYAQRVIKPRINHIPAKDRLAQYLEIINVLLDPKQGLASSGLSVPDFMSLAQDSDRQVVSPDSELLDDIPDNKREKLRILHNKYMLKHVTGIFFGPSASDIVKYKSAFRCIYAQDYKLFFAFGFRAVFQNITGLAIQVLANGVQSGQAHAFDLAGFN